MPIIKLPKLKLIPALQQHPANVSNFSKAVVTFTIRMIVPQTLIFANATCTVTIFEVVTSGGSVNLQRISGKRINLSSHLIQSKTVEFPQSSAFPGPSVFAHDYVAIIRIREKNGIRSETASTGTIRLDAAPLIVI